MKIFGSIKDGGKELDFYLNQNSDNLALENNVHFFHDNKMFVYIDGIVSKLSNKANKLSKSCESINKKIAYLHSINFNLESHISGSFNIFLYNYSRNELKIIRDTRGTRSLFYADNDGEFMFSSDQGSLIEKIPKVSLNEKKLIEFLNWDYKLDQETYFKEIFRIDPNNYLIYRNKVLKTKKYQLSNDLFNADETKDYIESFKKLLYESVINLTNRDKRIGVMMSGGLDSSAIAIALKENNFTNVRTYSANFNHIKNSDKLDETIYQKNIADLTSFKHSFVEMKDRKSVV